VAHLLHQIPNQHQGGAVQQLDALLQRALEIGASDIHVESGAESFRVRFRIDGRLKVVAQPQLAMRDALISRIKVLARMDIAEKRLPQDGRLQYPFNRVQVDVRVSSLPTVHGEKIVLRLLNPSQERPNLSTLGFEDKDQALVVDAISRPHGMVLVTGPTGSGKTLTLYSCLEHINREEVNISCVEDPCEIYLPGANQVSVHERAGLTFASALRALLRQDPDIIMVGEIRDQETAETSINAALTGHLVFSTLHTNNASGTFPRLVDLGVNPKTLSSAINIAMAQRLVRRLCKECKKEVPVTETDKKLIDSVMDSVVDKTQIEGLKRDTYFQAVGCPQCNNIGYKGRIGIHEAIRMDDAIEKVINENLSEREIKKASLPQGILDLKQDGIVKVLKGITTLDELSRVVDMEE